MSDGARFASGCFLLLEKPPVALSVNSLSLGEGEQHKLVCNVKHYYPHTVQAQWLREPKDSWKVPDVMKNVLSSSLQQSSNGTYSSSRHFLLTASMEDNGHRHTCHPKPADPHQERPDCGEVASTVWLLLLLSLAVVLMGVFLYQQKEEKLGPPLSIRSQRYQHQQRRPNFPALRHSPAPVCDFT